MKKILLAMFALLPGLMFAGDEFVMKGTITGLPDSCKISLALADADQGQENDTALVTMPASETFTIKSKLAGPTMLKFMVTEFNQEYGMDVPVMGFSFMAENETVELPTVAFSQLLEYQKDNLVDEKVTLKAGKLQAQYKEYLALLQPDKERINSIYAVGRDKLILAAYGMIDAKDDSVVMFRNQLDECDKSIANKKHAFMKSHPDYAITALLVSRDLHSEYQLTVEEIDELAKLVAGNADTRRLAIIEQNLAYAKKFAIGSPWGNEAVTMADGEVKTLQQLTNKGGLTIFDCWASWCGPCRMAIPKVKAISEKYASRLKVNSISCDQKEDDWRKAMDEEKMPWPQAIVTKEQMMPFMTAYNITTIPRLILVKDNKIMVSTNDPAEIEAFIETDK
jgi:thiol-disulfide isomerase/thioredoxin